ncbi:hypothetical protein U0C82_14615 [Fulvimarina sp. 2208YS6-2-32]|uniref:Uncharacterized protein n=1 Tax=Fulvimarina uroteuthidis TaxID=3098149 RepID=A0ABU5I4Q4_9HYPH|nr:hypothetical protein [Fulvimarina sp. 2208YS6-2-32]MDY8110372.1 hypothetical protein [Fulvimarina sp. 2208YS6-2-32]
MNLFLDGFISTFLYTPMRAPTPTEHSKAESVVVAKLGASAPAQAPSVNAAQAAARAQAMAKFTAWRLEATTNDVVPADHSRPAPQEPSGGTSVTGPIRMISPAAVKAAYAEV